MGSAVGRAFTRRLDVFSPSTKLMASIRLDFPGGYGGAYGVIGSLMGLWGQLWGQMWGDGVPYGPLASLMGALMG